jgi:hypothetical protein
MTMPRLVPWFGALLFVFAAGCGSGTTWADDGGATDTMGDAGSAGQGAAGSTGAGGSAAGTGGAGAAGHGSGGSTGAAGSTGTAGHGGGGSTGAAGHDGGASDGHSGDAVASCSDLETQYAAAMAIARICTAGRAGQCEQLASGQLAPCSIGCMMYVQDAATLNALKAQWLEAGCGNLGMAVCHIACIVPTAGDCVAGNGGGMCAAN